MNTPVHSVDEYILSFPENVQLILQSIRNLIKDAVPDAEEMMSYGLPSYKLNKKPLAYFGAFKNHIGFYGTPQTHETFEEELKNYKQGKGSVQFPYAQSIPYDLIRKMVLYKMSLLQVKK